MAIFFFFSFRFSTILLPTERRLFFSAFWRRVYYGWFIQNAWILVVFLSSYLTLPLCCLKIEISKEEKRRILRRLVSQPSCLCNRKHHRIRRPGSFDVDSLHFLHHNATAKASTTSSNGLNHKLFIYKKIFAVSIYRCILNCLFHYLAHFRDHSGY